MIRKLQIKGSRHVTGCRNQEQTATQWPSRRTKVTYCGNCGMSNMNYINNWENIPICAKSKRTSLEVIRGAQIVTYLNVVLQSDWPRSKTGRCKNFPLCMMWRASRIGVSIVPHSGFGVMTCYEISILGISASKYNIRLPCFKALVN